MVDGRNEINKRLLLFFFFFGETIAYLHPADKGKMAEKKRKLAEAMTLSGVRGDRI